MLFRNEVHISGTDEAIQRTISVAEILKKTGIAVEKKIETSTAMVFDKTKGKMVEVGKIDIVLGKSENFDDLMANDIKLWETTFESIRKLWSSDDPTNEPNTSWEADDLITASTSAVLEEAAIATREAQEVDDLLTAATSAHLMTAATAEWDDLMSSATGAPEPNDPTTAATAPLEGDELLTVTNASPEAVEEDKKK